MAKRNFPQESARRILWSDRESLLPHLIEHRDCGVFDAVEELARVAGWTMDSYVLAAVFNTQELITEVTK
jgi:hypothetical protein